MQKSSLYISHIFKNLIFSEKEIETINAVFQKVTVQKGDTLIVPGDIADSQYYILEGCLRSFYVDYQGKEHTLQFGTKDWWISDYTAFFTASPAVMTVEALQNSTLYKITQQQKDDLYSKIPKVETFFRRKLESAFSAFQRRILSGLSQPAKERYLLFIKTYPDIEKIVKNYHIASYLGITTESLSRIRKEM